MGWMEGNPVQLVLEGLPFGAIEEYPIFIFGAVGVCTTRISSDLNH